MIHNAKVGQSPLVVYAGQSREPRALPGAAPERSAGGHGAAAVQVGLPGRARPRRAAGRAARLQGRRRAAARPRLPQPADGRAGPGGRDGHPPDRATRSWRTRPDPAALAEAAELLLAAAQPDDPGRRPRGAQRRAEPRLVALAELLGAADLRELRLRVQRARPATRCTSARSPFAGGSRRLEAARWPTATCCWRVGAPLFQIIFPKPKPDPAAGHEARPDRPAVLGAEQEHPRRRGACWPTRRRRSSS